MDDPRQSSPRDDHLASAQSAEARGLFAAGWYATREEGRVVHPAEQTELLVSLETWRALRALDASARTAQAVA